MALQIGEQEFVNALVGIAGLTQSTLTPETVKLFVRCLEPYGLDRATQAVYKLALKAKPGRGMISAQDILEIICPEQAIEIDDDNLGAVVAGRIVGAVRTFGGNNAKEAEKFIGELGWRVIQDNGGWENLCRSLRDDDIMTFESQFRKKIATVAKMSRAGKLEPPRLPQNETREKLPQNVRALIGQVSNAVSVDNPKKLDQKSNALSNDEW